MISHNGGPHACRRRGSERGKEGRSGRGKEALGTTAVAGSGHEPSSESSSPEGQWTEGLWAITRTFIREFQPQRPMSAPLSSACLATVSPFAAPPVSTAASMSEFHVASDGDTLKDIIHLVKSSRSLSFPDVTSPGISRLNIVASSQSGRSFATRSMIARASSIRPAATHAETPARTPAASAPSSPSRSSSQSLRSG